MSSRTASVLVIGAGGYIGQGVAIAFRRAGYVVYGLLRNEAKAKFLLLHEIIPVIGDATDSSSWKQYVEKKSDYCGLCAGYEGYHWSCSQYLLYH